MNLYRCFTGAHCWIVGKPVSWTLDADLPRKTGSRYNDTLNGVRKPKGSVTMSRKLTVLIHCLVGDFRLKLHWGVKIPPVAGTGVNVMPVADGSFGWRWRETDVAQGAITSKIKHEIKQNKSCKTCTAVAALISILF